MRRQRLKIGNEAAQQLGLHGECRSSQSHLRLVLPGPGGVLAAPLRFDSLNGRPRAAGMLAALRRTGKVDDFLKLSMTLIPGMLVREEWHGLPEMNAFDFDLPVRVPLRK